MDGFIKVMAVVLILAYIGFAVWFICKRKTLGGGIAASIGFLCGGFIIIPVVEVIATIVCWVIIIAAVLGIIAILFGG